MMKRWFHVCLGIFLVLGLLAGCGSPQSPPPQVTVEEILQKIQQVADISALKAADGVKLQKLYAIPKDELQDFALLTAPTNIKADEIAIFKVKDPGNMENVVSKVRERVRKQAQSFSGYLPDEHYLIEHNVVKVKQPYVILIISKEAEKLSTVIDEVLK